MSLNDETHELALALVTIERARQDNKWGGDRHLHATTWAMILTEEYLELIRALNDHEGSDRIKEELVQVAAVCTAWIEDMVRK